MMNVPPVPDSAAPGPAASDPDAASAPDRPTRRTGRRPGRSDTRAEILAAARAEFAGRGFEGATVRGIARAAGVDPALVHHYFGSKEKVFLAAMEFPVDPAAVIERVLGDPESAGEALARFVVGL
jgi:AcrR family transcriptional regulator